MVIFYLRSLVDVILFQDDYIACIALVESKLVLIKECFTVALELQTLFQECSAQTGQDECSGPIVKL